MRRVSGTPAARIALPFIVGAIGLAAGYLLSVSLSGYFVFLAVSAVVAAIAILGLGIVTGSAGMIALCQLTFAAVGAWIVSLLNVLNAPGGFIVWLILGGLAAGVVGVLVGLPALRLRGVNLAVVTLGFAAAADVTLVQIQFPGSTDGVSVLRPDAFSDDRSYFFFSVLVLVICGIGVYFLQSGRWGSSWKSVAFSERGTASVGASVPGSKLTAFAVSATLGGVSGGLIAGQVGLPFASSFSPIQSLALYVLAIMSGAYLIDMAIFGGIVWIAVPELLKRWGIPQDWGFVIFGVLGVQALTSGSNLGQSIRNAWWKRQAAKRPVELAAPLAEEPGRDAVTAAPPATAPAPADPSAAPVLVVTDLGVAFGQVKALNGVSLAVPPNTIMGLIGPNGAGKSTFVDAVTGFLPQHTGSVSLDGRDLRGLSATARARLGVRRTFQQDRVPPTLTVEAYVRFVARRRLTIAEIDDALAFFGCPTARTRLQNVDVGTRRLVEVAANVLARPRILILDEPAAGLSHEEHLELGARLLQAPARFGMSIVLIEHDLDLVRSVCSTITVLDFGEVLASGPQAEVLADPAVMKAYMGETEML
ncbi:branched-chain amino acid ABC transporter permease [Leifsonia sp. Root227]|uniref:branched-chain amino acid ABC transporter ATP-binding protein/permease n=1 Tax=Leifsonia sp. Root227 TaxID=1736496 RepID=UPI0006FA55F0|nr:ATP-binding cassette domain-containing protein [Leifsonia sp. Root227]KRC50450.1 branched-chain amino acid ABC transporter permease [Leifsonia sp. Root227]